MLVYYAWLKPFNLSTRSTRIVIKKGNISMEGFDDEGIGKNH